MKTAQRISKWSFYLALLPIVLGVFGWQGWTWWSWASSPVAASAAPDPGQPKPIQIQIPPGTAAQQIGQDLETAGLIRSAKAWDLWTRWQMLRDRQGGFQAGSYEISPDESLQAIADKIWQGEVVQRSFTIPEGWSLQQMGEYFETQGFFTAQEFLAAAKQIPAEQYSWLPQGIPHLEGFLYPDTYQIDDEQVTAQVVVRQMLNRFAEVALPLYQQTSAQTRLSLLEWVTLSSIVEREAVVPNERSRIAGVFTKRLQQGMKLEADPTVEYALGIRQTPDQPLTFRQVETPSPYNTYLNPGLPPGPIASPGVASLEAVLNPEQTDYLFFMARYDGTHIFSRTLEEHQAAIATVERDLANQQSTPEQSPSAPPLQPSATQSSN